MRHIKYDALRQSTRPPLLFMLCAVVLGVTLNQHAAAQQAVDRAEIHQLLEDRQLYPPGELEGKPLVLYVWGTWAPPALKMLPAVDQLYQQYHAKGLEVVGVVVPGGPSWKDIIAQQKIQWPQYYHGNAEVMDRLEIEAVPTTLLLDAQGRVVQRLVGSRSQFPPGFHTQVEALLGGATTQPTATQPAVGGDGAADEPPKNVDLAALHAYLEKHGIDPADVQGKHLLLAMWRGGCEEWIQICRAAYGPDGLVVIGLLNQDKHQGRSQHWLWADQIDWPQVDYDGGEFLGQKAFHNLLITPDGRVLAAPRNLSPHDGLKFYRAVGEAMGVDPVAAAQRIAEHRLTYETFRVSLLALMDTRKKEADQRYRAEKYARRFYKRYRWMDEFEKHDLVDQVLQSFEARKALVDLSKPFVVGVNLKLSEYDFENQRFRIEPGFEMTNRGSRLELMLKPKLCRVRFKNQKELLESWRYLAVDLPMAPKQAKQWLDERTKAGQGRALYGVLRFKVTGGYTHDIYDIDKDNHLNANFQSLKVYTDKQKNDLLCEINATKPQ